MPFEAKKFARYFEFPAELVNDETGSAFCAIKSEAVTIIWKAKLSPVNTVFQAEMLAFKAAIEWANTINEEVNIWRVSESSLQPLKFFYIKSKIIQEAGISLLGYPNEKRHRKTFKKVRFYRFI
ncbi:hypothetical protein AVEN_44409-1 [Araneus ventricosus]|uniref:RNase H type-1 domain-containing protein n=1 Tax=Araneus ventricosus TaxID=182803 RepID=A0A4Y2LU58_ARAVE|nr:hypothetical protein AVEN_44409-1 [Araneus ventricosus]